MSGALTPAAPAVDDGTQQGPTPGPPSLRRRLLSFPMGPRARWLNIALAVALVGAIVIAFLEIGNPPNPTPVERTAVVTRGDVTAKVTGSGNAESQAATPVSFQTNGTITGVVVKPGDTVTLGEVLATIDPTAAKESLQTAQAGLAGARAAYDQAASGPTEVKKQQDQAAIAQAKQGVDNADASVTNAQKQRDLDTTAQASAVRNAQKQLDDDQDSTETEIRSAQAQLRADTTTQNTAVGNARSAASSSSCTTTTVAPAPSSGSSTTTPTATAKPAASSSCSASTSTKQAVTQAEQTQSSTLQKDRLAVTSAQQSQKTTLDKDRQAITAARQTQSDTLLKDNQAIATNKQSVTTAQGQVTNAQLAATADLHPQTPAQIAQARSDVDSARVQVDTARVGVDQTQLKAPQAGVVLAVNGKVGESSGGESTSSGTTGGTGTSGGTASAASNAASAASTAGNGFITIANLSRLAVTANIAEADAAGIQLGQQATVTFPATNATATGSVTQITPQSTVTNNVVLYPIQVSLDTAPAGVGVGSTASLSITTGTATGVLEAPNAAITTVGTNHTVTVRRDGADTVVPVGIGRVGDTVTEITNGVVQGDVLVLPAPAAPTTGGTGGFPRIGGGR